MKAIGSRDASPGDKLLSFRSGVIDGSVWAGITGQKGIGHRLIGGLGGWLSDGLSSRLGDKLGTGFNSRRDGQPGLADADRLQVVPLDEDEENQCIRLLSFCKRHSPNRSIERVAPDERMGQLPSHQSDILLFFQDVCRLMQAIKDHGRVRSDGASLYLRFHIQHAPSTTRFTCNTTFSLGVEINQKRIFLQEQHSNVIFILNHEVKQDGGRAFSIDYLVPPTSKSCFVYQLTAKSMKTSLSLQSEPGIYTEWSRSRGCVWKRDNDIANGALQVVLADPGVLDCSICHEPLCTPVFQRDEIWILAAACAAPGLKTICPICSLCGMGHLACSRCCSELKGVCLCCMPNNNRCRAFEKFIESVHVVYHEKLRRDLSLSVCVKKKVISSEEMEKVRIEYIPNLDGRLKVMLTNLDMLYCSTCFKPLCSPIIQCEKGHLSCSSCCSEMKKLCPLCYTSIGCYGYNHSRGLENIIDTAIIPCKNAKRGCKLRMRLRYHSEHEHQCNEGIDSSRVNQCKNIFTRANYKQILKR
ncbi:aminotransferase-like mobile domain-containing protein [Tanacetum coccineum]